MRICRCVCVCVCVCVCFHSNAIACVACVNENRKKRKPLRFLQFSFTQRTQRKRLRLNGNRLRGCRPGVCWLKQTQTQRPRPRPRSNSDVIIPPLLHQPRIPSDTATVGPVPPQTYASSGQTTASGSTPMSQLLSSMSPRIGPDQFVELIYRGTAYSGDTADTSTARRRRVSFTYLFTHAYLLIVLATWSRICSVTPAVHHQCCCPRGKSLSSTTNLQVLVFVLDFVLGPQVLYNNAAVHCAIQSKIWSRTWSQNCRRQLRRLSERPVYVVIFSSNAFVVVTSRNKHEHKLLRKIHLEQVGWLVGWFWSGYI